MTSPVTTTRVRIDSVSFSRGKIREESITVRRFLLVRIRRGEKTSAFTTFQRNGPPTLFWFSFSQFRVIRCIFCHIMEIERVSDNCRIISVHGQIFQLIH